MGKSFLAVALLAACASSSSNDDTGSASGGSGDQGGGAGRGGSAGLGGAAGMASTCPPGVGAWMSTNPDPLAVGMAQYDRCIALCEKTQAASCPGFVFERCTNYCNYHQNHSVNGWCTEPIEAFIACFEALNDPCQNPEYRVAGSCEAEIEELDCCWERYCADRVNAGRCL